MIDTELQFSFLVISLSGFGGRMMLALKKKMNEEVFCMLLFSEIVENWYDFFLKCLIKFSSEPIWAQCFPLWKVLNY